MKAAVTRIAAGLPIGKDGMYIGTQDQLPPPEQPQGSIVKSLSHSRISSCELQRNNYDEV